MPLSPNISKSIKIQEEYEKYVQRVLNLMQKKLEILVTFRKHIGEEKLNKLHTLVKEGENND